MKKQDLVKQVHHLEFVNDQLGAEIAYLDQLMRQIGFTNGLETVKCSAQEIISGDHNSTSEE